MFTGIALSEEAVLYATAVTGELSGFVEGVRWVSADNLHVTLKFLGSFDPLLVTSFLEEMGIAARHLPLTLRLGGIGGYPSLGSARVIWVGAEDTGGRLRKAFADIECVAERYGFPREKRPFRPHVTLGRARARPVRISRDTCDRFKGEVLLNVDEIVLFRSELKSGGARYSIAGKVVRSTPG